VKERGKIPWPKGDLPGFVASLGMFVEQPNGESVGEGVMTELNILTVAEPKPMTIDEDHLGRMTLGDRSLEREVLEIFVRQITLTLKRIAGATPSCIGAAAHTLKGSARGIGAWRVARAAERLEQMAASGGGDQAMNAAVSELEAASVEACASIKARLADKLVESGTGIFGGGSRDH
jgi:HPt (histidine-containing phosphotransfer) domain-containing protein